MKIWGKYLIVLLALCLLVLGGCQNQTEETTEQLPEGVIEDQLGREVILPEQIDKVAATHIYGGKMLFAMGQKNKVAYQMQLGADLEALAQIDEYYGSLPTISTVSYTHLDVYKRQAREAIMMLIFTEKIIIKWLHHFQQMDINNPESRHQLICLLYTSDSEQAKPL